MSKTSFLSSLFGSAVSGASDASDAKRDASGSQTSNAQALQTPATPTFDDINSLLADHSARMTKAFDAKFDAILARLDQTPAEPATPANASDASDDLTPAQKEKLEKYAQKGGSFYGWLAGDPVIEIIKPSYHHIRVVRPDGSAPIVEKTQLGTVKRSQTPASGTGSPSSNATPASGSPGLTIQADRDPSDASDAHKQTQGGITLSGSEPDRDRYVIFTSKKRRQSLSLAQAFTIYLTPNNGGTVSDASDANAIVGIVKDHLVKNVLPFFNGYLHLEPDRGMLWIYCGSARSESDKRQIAHGEQANKAIRQVVNVLNQALE